jgi:hypothetical protein
MLAIVSVLTIRVKVMEATQMWEGRCCKACVLLYPRMNHGAAQML